ncbi:hypothetical protein GCM10012275_50990 [Longimycelium tulufanense]|uniref:Uncharacterized protein n=1 Tax=Longimycelium tulufanense TaxID=907463 RepID=A0A8J3FW51_9PSEU|nr:hypothetical protein [Longimycelium tulufanense]GGM74097.1 hypothetical protein GCM10012275_50990 [Longimycelium tulufanense]
MPRPATGKTPTVTMRVDRDLWVEFERATGKGRRNEVLVEFVRWYCRKPGATRPRRPDTTNRDDTERAA